MNIVFLDIDGVLMPYDAEFRFCSKDKYLIDNLSNKYGIDYSIYDYYDVSAVYYDWQSEAVSRLKHVLDKTESKIIISSDWRSKHFPNKMKDLLTIQGLDKYYFTDNIISDEYVPLAQKRSIEINNSLETYSIDNFVILDDMEKLKEYFKENLVLTRNYMSVYDMNECIRILKKEK